MCGTEMMRFHSGLRAITVSVCLVADSNDISSTVTSLFSSEGASSKSKFLMPDSDALLWIPFRLVD